MTVGNRPSLRQLGTRHLLCRTKYAKLEIDDLAKAQIIDVLYRFSGRRSGDRVRADAVQICNSSLIKAGLHRCLMPIAAGMTFCRIMLMRVDIGGLWPPRR